MWLVLVYFSFFFFFNDTATTEIYTLSLHDALPISRNGLLRSSCLRCCWRSSSGRSEEHTSELQSRFGISYAAFCLKKKKETYRVVAAVARTRVCPRGVGGVRS